jgi:hypothetical protein
MADFDGGQILSRTAASLLVWAADDYIELFGVQEVLRRVVGTLSPEEQRMASLAALTELLSAGLVRVGDMESEAVGLTYWDGTTTQVLDRLRSTWSTEKPPRMGEGPWVAATDAGKRIAGVPG